MSTSVKEYAPLNYLTAVEQLGRTPRPGQQKLVETGVDLEVGETRLVKAPTATGKSLGALMIAGFRWNLDPENKTVIATYTRLLQDQYGKSKDMDQARELFPDMVFAVLKGANNYLCRVGARRFTAIHEDYQKLADGEDDPGELAGRTHLWKAKADTRTCGKHTPEQCGFAAAKLRARNADCVITNHALVMVNSVNTNVFGQHSLLIVDEIHNFPRAAESFATEEINFNDVEDELRKSKSYEAVDGQRFLAQVRTMIPPGSGFSDRKPTGEELVKVATLFDQKPWAKGMPELTPIYDWTVSAIQYIRKENPPRLALIAPQPWKARTPNLILRHAEIDISVAAQRGLATGLGEITEEHGDQRFERAVLMMSATTGTPSKPTYVADRCGVQADLVKVDSALDYPGQMRMTLQNLPNGFTYESATVRLCTETSGRTLVLCRSWKMVDAIYDELRAANPGFRVFKQDRDEPTNNGYLVRQFTADTSSVLVGTASFFEGIDVPGEALSQVIVTQLPMLMDFESNPLGWERKNRAGSRYIPDMQIPATALILEQMFGRLIRSTQDKGLVVVLDANATRGWGQRATLDAIRSFEVPVVARRDALAWFAS